MPKIGLILSGGMGKGAYQVGALHALTKYFCPTDFKCVSAASIGVLNTYAFLTDKIEQAVSIWKSANFKNNKRLVYSVMKSDFLQSAVADIFCGKRIIPAFYAPLLDLKNRELYYYNLSEISPYMLEPYLHASIALPCINAGIDIEGKKLFDGAVVDNIPIYPVLKNKLDYIICIYFDNFNYIFEDYDIDKRIIKLTFPDDKLISNSVYITHDSILHMIEEGYRQTEIILDEFFSDGIDDVPKIISKINQRNTNSQRIIRITGDVVVTNMNKFVKKIIKRSIIMEGGNKI